MTEFTERECMIMASAVIKCNLLKSYTEAGLPVTLTEKNFGFERMSDSDEESLLIKLNEISQIAWLNESRKNEKSK